jgi:hypothetical protein
VRPRNLFTLVASAVEIGRRFLGSRVFLESQPGHPLLVGVPDERGPRSQISTKSFAAEALAKFEAFLETAEGGVQYVFESHPVLMTHSSPERRSAIATQQLPGRPVQDHLIVCSCHRGGGVQ